MTACVIPLWGTQPRADTAPASVLALSVPAIIFDSHWEPCFDKTMQTKGNGTTIPHGIPHGHSQLFRNRLTP
jgi:hypothetical protein